MKKIIYATTIALFLVFTTSCNNEKRDLSKTKSFYCAEVPETDSLYTNYLSYLFEDSLKETKILDYYEFVEESEPTYNWRNGDTIKIWFQSGSAEAQKRVISVLNLWSKYANIYFAQATPGTRAHIRVSFKTNGYWAHVGTRGMQYYTSVSLHDLDKETDSILFQSVVLHEFGHVLGLLHEHQNPDGKIKWNTEAVYNYYKEPPNEWNKEYVDQNVLKKFDKSQTNYSQYDPLSIMHYPIPRYLTLDETEVPFNYTLSETDILYISKKYPK